ncbi:MAG: hypothetical protein ACXVD0_00210 [Nocardioides sp.]
MPSRVPSRVPSRTPLRSLLGVVLATGLALTLLPGTPSGPVASAPVTSSPALRLAAAAPSSPTYTTFTLNIRHDLGPTKARQDMRKALTTLGDAGGFQEMSDLEDRQSLMRLCDRLGWGWYMPKDVGQEIPIVWNRDRFRLIDGHTVKVHDAVAGMTPARYINVVRLREVATGKVFGFINTHTIAQASYDAQASDPKRIPLLRKHLRMLRHEILALFAATEHVFVSGDLNVNYLADRRRRVPGLPTAELGDLVSFDMPLAGSRGPTSLLDYGMTVKNAGGLQLASSRIVHGWNSDHDAVQLTYRPVDLFETGPLFSRPDGAAADRGKVLNRVARAIDDAEPGALVRIITPRIDDVGVTRAILAAAAEGVDVRVLVGGGEPSDQEREVAAALGTDTTATSWFQRCTRTCLGGSGTEQTNVVLVSRAGGVTDLALVGSGPLVAGEEDRWTDTFRSSTAAVYDGYGRLFARYAADATDTTRTRVLRWGAYRALLYPVPHVERRDPVLKALGPVGCRRAHGLRTPDGRTNVRVAVQAWSGSRGRLIAARLGELEGRGCDVAAVLGPKVLGGIRKQLARAHVPTRDARTGQSLLVVDGRYGSRGGAHYAWTGGPSWTDHSIDSDGVTLVVPSRDAVLACLDGFTRAWRHG